MKILNALLCLKKNNIFYKDITINYQGLDNWKDKFISSQISFEILQYNTNHAKQERYSAGFNIDNYKSELHHTIDNAKLDFDGMLIGCFHTDADNTWTNPTLRLIAAVTYYKNNLIAN